MMGSRVMLLDDEPGDAHCHCEIAAASGFPQLLTLKNHALREATRRLRVSMSLNRCLRASLRTFSKKRCKDGVFKISVSKKRQNGSGEAGRSAAEHLAATPCPP